MFWKKKNKTPELISFNDNERRNAVRIQPLEPIYLALRGHKDSERQNRLVIVDISATGLSFKKSDFEPAQKVNICIDLPVLDADQVQTINTQVKILKCTGDICHCQFQQLSTTEQSWLEHFILAQQKQQIRRQKQIKAEHNLE